MADKVPEHAGTAVLHCLLVKTVRLTFLTGIMRRRDLLSRYRDLRVSQKVIGKSLSLPDIRVHSFDRRTHRVLGGLAPNSDIPILVASPDISVDVLHPTSHNVLLLHPCRKNQTQSRREFLDGRQREQCRFIDPDSNL